MVRVPVLPWIGLQYTFALRFLSLLRMTRVSRKGGRLFSSCSRVVIWRPCRPHSDQGLLGCLKHLRFQNPILRGNIFLPQDKSGVQHQHKFQNMYTVLCSQRQMWTAIYHYNIVNVLPLPGVDSIQRQDRGFSYNLMRHDSTFTILFHNLS